jgi:hypothetical protein
MKKLSIICLVLGLFFIYLGRAQAQSAFHPVGKEGANLNYTFQEDCEKAEGQTCYDVYNCPADECILIDEVDDIGIYTGKKLLRHSPVRKADKEAKIEAEKLSDEDKKAKKKAAKDKVKGFKFKGSAIKELRDELNDFMNENKEAQE